MISLDLCDCQYYLYNTKNAYGQPVLSEEPQGEIKIACYVSSQAIQDNINYKNAAYVGFTHAPIDDTYVIQWGEEKLKVLYVNSKGRIKQVFLAKI